MRKIREVLRLRFGAGLNYRQIRHSTKVSLGSIQTLLKRAEALGLSWPLPDELDDAALAQLFYPSAEVSVSTRHVQPDWSAMHQELKHKGITKQLLWEEYTAAYPNHCYSYSQYCERYQQWLKRQKRSMRQMHRAGEKAKVEVAVQIVERWVLARLRQLSFFSLAELNRCLASLLDELNQKPFKQLPGNRKTAFEQLDQPALKPLPAHMPSRHHKHQQWTPGQLKNRARDIGSEVLAWVDHQLTHKDHPEQAYRVCLGLLALSREYPTPRLDRAGRIANQHKLYQLNALSKVQLLIIDDWGLEALKPAHRNDLMEIMDDRHGASSTMVISQLPTDQWYSCIGDSTLADAILDRLMHNAHRLPLKGESMRKKQGLLTQVEQIQ